MYPRRNRSAQRGNNRQPDKDLSADIEAENIQNEAGNEGAFKEQFLTPYIIMLCEKHFCFWRKLIIISDNGLENKGR